MLLTFLQKVVNSDAKVDREYAEGRGVVDICITYKNKEYLIEVKLKERDSEEKSKNQLAGYLEKNGEKEGWLVVFDRDRKKGNAIL
jgi:RecB family endonuclease NucS